MAAGFLALGAAGLAGPGVARAQTPAQKIFQEQADSLRAHLRCRPPTEWPELPRRPRTVSIEARVDSSGVVSYIEGGVVVASTVQLPQFANFFDPTTEVCEPAIVLEADEFGNFNYSRPFAKTAGVAPVVFFDLLGVSPAISSGSGEGSDPASDPVSDPASDPVSDPVSD